MAGKNLMELQGELNQIRHKLSMLPKGVKYAKTHTALLSDYESKLIELEKYKSSMGKNKMQNFNANFRR